MDLELWNKRRRELHYSYDDLAKKSGLGRRTIANIFSGARSNPTIDTIQKIERALGLSDITDEEAAAGVRDYAVRNVTPDEDDLLEDFRELGKKKGADAQKAVRDMMQAMLK